MTQPTVSRVVALLGAMSLLVIIASPATSQIADVPEGDLIERLKEDDVDRRRDAAYELVKRQSSTPEVAKALGNAVSNDDAQVRFQALLGLARMGEKAEPATAALIGQLNDRDDQIRFRAADALGKIGAAALPALLEKWGKASSRERIALAQAFGEMGAVAVDAKPFLNAAALEPSGDLPRHAAAALVRIAPDDEALAVSIAQHSQPEVRVIGIAALAAVSAPQEQTLVQLKAAATDSQPIIRETALIALAKSSLSQEVKADQISAALVDEVESVRAAALVAMRRAKLFDEAFAQRCASQLEAANSEVANSLLRAIKAIGPNASGVFHALVDALERQSLDHALAADTVASFGIEIVPAILKAIEEHPDLEPVLALALARLGEPAVPALLAGIQRDDELVRLAATRAIGAIEPLTDELRQTLKLATQDRSSRIRTVALNALLSRSSDDEELREMVRRCCADEAMEVRAVAVAAVGRLSFSQEVKEPLLKVALSDSSSEVIRNALQSLGTSAELLNQQRGRVLELLKHEDSQVRQGAMAAVAQFDGSQADESLVAAIVDALSDSDGAVRLAGTQAVRRLGLKQESVLVGVAGNLGDDIELLLESLETLSEYGPQAASQVTVLLNLLAHERADVRSATVTALSMIDNDGARKVGWLTGVLNDSEWDVRRVAAAELAKLGPQAAPAIPRLFELLASRDDSDYASSAIKEINAATVEAVPMLISKLDSDERRVGFYAVTLLGKLGPAAAEALPKLEQMLEKERGDGERVEQRRKQLRETIRAIQGEEETKAAE